MVDEHFGINLVDFLVRGIVPLRSYSDLRGNQFAKAAGAIPATHALGKPLKDIVVPVGSKRRAHAERYRLR